MGSVIAVASGKGGTGKTTTCAALSAALSRMGKKVLAVDCDFGLRNLDLALGLYDNVVFDLADAINGTCSPEDTIIHHGKYTSLDFISAPQDETKATFTEESFATFIRDIAPDYDFVFLDCPASIGHAFSCAIGAADKAFVVTTPQAYSIRDAQKIADIIIERGIEDTRLIINMIRIRFMRRGYSKNIDDIMDAVALPLAGVIPYDEGVGAHQNRHLDIMDDPSLQASQAFSNIAKRLLGERVPILKMKNKRFK